MILLVLLGCFQYRLEPYHLEWIDSAVGNVSNGKDSDGDGQSDAYEMNNGSNPFSEYSQSYEQSVGQCVD